jgi:hypothetical protein
MSIGVCKKFCVYGLSQGASVTVWADAGPIVDLFYQPMIRKNPFLKRGFAPLLPSVRERVAKARGIGGVLFVWCNTSFMNASECVTSFIKYFDVSRFSL